VTTSGYFAGDSSDLYASFHAAEGDAKAAILIAPPFGDERRACTRFLAQFARRLAAAGCDVLRVDLSATGESPGDLRDAMLPRWAGDIDAAYCELRKLSSAPVHIGLGVRLGANLLLRSSQADALVLWEPLLDGGKYVDEIVRRKLIKEMKGSGQAANDATSIAAAWAAGDTVDCDGFAISAALACELRSLKMASDLPATRMQLVHVSGARKLPAAWQAIADSANGEVLLIRDKPFWGRLDYYVSRELEDAAIAFCTA
jgi:exosortase A-associated hydrolase 2